MSKTKFLFEVEVEHDAPLTDLSALHTEFLGPIKYAIQTAHVLGPKEIKSWAVKTAVRTSGDAELFCEGLGRETYVL